MSKALMIIDVQACMFFGDWKIPDSADLLARIGDRLLQARVEGVPVIHVQNDGGADEMDAPGEPYWHLVFGALDNELVFRKTKPNLFENLEVVKGLRARGITTLEIVGVQSEICVRSTSIGAMENNFEVLLDRNMHATFDGNSAGDENRPSAKQLSDHAQFEVESWKSI